MRTNVLECGYTFLSFHDIIPRNELHGKRFRFKKRGI